MQETLVQFLGQEDCLRRQRLPTPVFWPREFHGQRRLVGYSTWDPKELDRTEWLSLTSQILPKTEEEGTLLNSCSMASITLILKPEKTTTRIQNYRPISLMNMDIKVLHKIKASNIYKEFYTTSAIYPRNATMIQHTIKHSQCNISY